MTDTTYIPQVGDRVKYTGLNLDNRDHEGTGAWELLKVGAYGTVDSVVDENRIFVIFDDVEMPFAWLARSIGQSTGWPILASEVEPI